MRPISQSVTVTASQSVGRLPTWMRTHIDTYTDIDIQMDIDGYTDGHRCIDGYRWI